MKVVPGLKANASVVDALRWMTQMFRGGAVDTPEADARLLLGHALRLDRARLISQDDRILDAREVDAVSALAARRLKHEPVARIFGRKEFWDLSLIVTPDVLVPRPESETVIEAALDAAVRDALQMEKLRILDIGTGSGALLLALLSELPKAVGTGADISEAALQVARENAERNGLADRCVFVACDMATGLEGPFEFIVSNPPYIARGDIASLPPDVRDYDPAIALDGGDDGLNAYRAIAAQTPGLLVPGGKLIVELGIGQEAAVRALFTKAGLTVAPAQNDLGGIPRALSAILAP